MRRSTSKPPRPKLEHLGPAHDAIIAEARMATTRPTMETAPETLWGGTPGHALPGGEHSLRNVMGR